LKFLEITYKLYAFLTFTTKKVSVGVRKELELHVTSKNIGRCYILLLKIVIFDVGGMKSNNIL